MGVKLIKAEKRSGAPAGDTEEEQARNFEVMQTSFVIGRAVKMLLYGPGECGKTTILRRVMLDHGERGSILQNQLLEFRGRILYNVIEGAAMVLNALKTMFKVKLETEFRAYGDLIMEVEHFYASEKKSVINADLEHEGLIEAIQQLYYNSKVFKKVLTQRTVFSLFETWSYFVEKLKDYPTWGGPAWNPSTQDLLHSRVRSTGHAYFFFQDVEQMGYELIDIGGQRNERRKFMALFKGIDVVLFVGSMSDYNERLYEDVSENRLRETFNVFKAMLKRDEFSDNWVIMFLNKFDLFKEKYQQKRIPIENKYGTNNPPPSVEDDDEECNLAQAWFKESFLELVPDDRRSRIKIYVTSALDEKGNNINRVMDYCKTLIIGNNIGAENY
eukprot:maker-scaffold_54-snap-gene-0.38-mRNA-1 protein AED:0.04 eAED:0.04 QI:147/1/1/1/1/1/7/55/385